MLGCIAVHINPSVTQVTLAVHGQSKRWGSRHVVAGEDESVAEQTSFPTHIAAGASQL
jgi:hypothetical protein